MQFAILIKLMLVNWRSQTIKLRHSEIWLIRARAQSIRKSILVSEPSLDWVWSWKGANCKLNPKSKLPSCSLRCKANEKLTIDELELSRLLLKCQCKKKKGGRRCKWFAAGELQQAISNDVASSLKCSVSESPVEEIPVEPVTETENENPSFSLDTKPHILFILADDYGSFDTGFQGSEILTPNLDLLAATGIKLENYYVHRLIHNKPSFRSGVDGKCSW